MRSTSPPLSDPEPTLQDLPRYRAFDRQARERVLLRRVVTGCTDAGFEMYATCLRCGADVKGGRRRHLHEVDEMHRSRGGETGVRLAYLDACTVCGGSVVELHAASRARR